MLPEILPPNSLPTINISSLYITKSEKEGEPEHPHVHLCVLMRDTYGQRLNPRKNDLFEWRVRFAEKLREEGVECAATKRQHRGKILKLKMA